MADDDDDESFGAFTFASSSKFHQSPHLPHHINGLKFPITPDSTQQKLSVAVVSGNNVEDDDEWGDFVESPVASAASSRTTSSKPFDPFNFFPSNSLLQSESASDGGADSRGKIESEKTPAAATQWVKPKGAIPLSIFGEFDEEEEGEKPKGSDPHDSNGKDSSNVGNVKNKTVPTADVGISANHDKRTNVNDRPGSHSSRDRLSGNESILELVGLNTGFSSVDNGKVSDISTEHNNGHKELMFGNGFQTSSTEMNLGLDVLNAGFTQWKVGVNQAEPSLSSKPDKVNGVYDQTQLHVKENGGLKSMSNSLDLNLKNENTVKLDAWDFDFNGFQSNLGTLSSSMNVSSSEKDVGILNSISGVKSEELGSTLDNGAEDDDGWEFKDAFSESVVRHGNGQVQPEVQKLFGTKPYSGGSLVASNGSFNSHLLSDLSFGPFAPSNGISSRPSDIFGLHTNGSAATQNGFLSDTSSRDEQTSHRSGLDTSKVGNSEDGEEFGDFAVAFAEAELKTKVESKIHEGADTNVLLSDSVSGSNGSINLFASLNGSTGVFGTANEISIGSDKKDEFDGTGSVFPRSDEIYDDSTLYRDSSTLYRDSRIEQTVGEDANGWHFGVESAVSDEDFGEFTVAPATISQVQEAMKIRGKNHSEPLAMSVFGDKESEMVDSSNIQDDFLHQPDLYKRNDNTPHSNVSINDLVSKLYSQAEETSLHDVLPSQNVLFPSNSILDVSLVEGGKDVGATARKYNLSSSEDTAANQGGLFGSGDSDESISPEAKLDSYMSFYSKLNDELCHLARCHPESGKEVYRGTCRDDSITGDYLVEDQKIRGADLSRFVNLLQKPELHVFELEYDLERRLASAGSDSRSTIELMEHVKALLKILSLGSLENQLAYVSFWSKIIDICAQELQHGSQIYKESLERNVQSQLLADPRGKRYICSLCEIYRVAVIIGASARLYKPWTFVSLESSNLFARLDECHSVWSSSGLREAVFGISDDFSLEEEKDILDSLKYTHGLDSVALQNNVFTEQEAVCRLSLLTPRVAPGMTMVMWDNEQCFVKLANLAANLISSDFPKLPRLQVNQS